MLTAPVFSFNHYDPLSTQSVCEVARLDQIESSLAVHSEILTEFPLNLALKYILR
jgi:hypothetical protein